MESLADKLRELTYENEFAAECGFAAADEIERLRAALETIAHGDVPRPVAVPWRENPSKHDKCSHGLAMYEDCGECISGYACATLNPSGPSK